MDEVFEYLGINQKESLVYIELLKNGDLPAAEIAKLCRETRTNTYMILDKLVENSLVVVDDTRAVKSFSAVNPKTIQQKLAQKQDELVGLQTQLKRGMPELLSVYNVTRMKPGVVYLEGIKGLKLLLDDMVRSNTDAVIFPSNDVHSYSESWGVLQDGLKRRARADIRSRMLFYAHAKEYLDVKSFNKNNIEIKFWGGKKYPGEIVVYGNKCVFTTYEPKMIITILTNEVMATTLTNIFDELWAIANKH